MATHIAFHEVDDVDHWLSSSKRDEVFGALGITTRAFRDPAGSNRVGLIAEIPDFAALLVRRWGCQAPGLGYA
jgi:hypothetical protein